MIQRIQSLFLLIGSLFLLSMLFLPLAHIVDGDGQNVRFIYRGFIFLGETVKNRNIDNYALTVILLVSIVLNVSIIFLFKKRIIQIRLCVINIFLMLGSIGLIYFSLHFFTKDWDAIINYKVTVIFPLIGAIFNYLAIRAIGKDEALVKSLDRIR